VPATQPAKNKIKVCVKPVLMKGEKKMYSPKVSEEHVKKLWKLKSISEVLTGERKPMTDMVNEAVEEYLNKTSKKINHLLRDKDMATISLQLMDRQKE
jgi:hypothetical protein